MLRARQVIKKRGAGHCKGGFKLPGSKMAKGAMAAAAAFAACTAFPQSCGILAGKAAGATAKVAEAVAAAVGSVMLTKAAESAGKQKKAATDLMIRNMGVDSEAGKKAVEQIVDGTFDKLQEDLTKDVSGEGIKVAIGSKRARDLRTQADNLEKEVQEQLRETGNISDDAAKQKIQDFMALRAEADAIMSKPAQLATESAMRIGSQAVKAAQAAQASSQPSAPITTIPADDPTMDRDMYAPSAVPTAPSATAAPSAVSSNVIIQRLDKLDAAVEDMYNMVSRLEG